MAGEEVAASRTVVHLKEEASGGEGHAFAAATAAAFEDALGSKGKAARSANGAREQAPALDQSFPSAKTVDTIDTIMTTETVARNDSLRRRALLASSGDDGVGSMRGVALTRLRSVRDYVDTLSFRFASFRDSIRRSFRRSGRLSSSADQYISTTAFRKKVFGDLEAINAVEHATLLRGYGLPRVDKYVLKRFLIARKFDVEKAYEMLMTYIDWRISHPESAVTEEEVQASLRAEKIYVTKHTDKNGHICVVIVVRKHSMREVTIEETKRMILYTLDKVISTFLRGSRSMDKLTCVIDLQKIGWDSLDGEALKAILTFLQNFFPETLALMVLWKPPTIFWVVYKMVVPFVDKKTRGKIIMAYKQSDLTHAFDVDTLPKTLGGNGEDEEMLIRIQDLSRDDIDY